VHQYHIDRTGIPKITPVQGKSECTSRNTLKESFLGIPHSKWSGFLNVGVEFIYCSIRPAYPPISTNPATFKIQNYDPDIYCLVSIVAILSSRKDGGKCPPQNTCCLQSVQRVQAFSCLVL